MCEHYVAAQPSRSGSTSCGRSPSGSSASGSPGSAGARPGSTADGGSARYRDVRAFRDDPRREAVGAIETTGALVHLRRPSRLSTLALADTQPFDDPAGRYAFSHNGDLRDYKALRATYREAGRIHGRADTEVGARWLEDAWRADEPVGHLLAASTTVRRPRQPRGARRRRARRTTTPATARTRSSRFRLGRIGVVSTGIYSLDRSRLPVRRAGATERRLVPLADDRLARPYGTSSRVIGCARCTQRRRGEGARCGHRPDPAT